jgi:hypothetical protein
MNVMLLDELQRRAWFLTHSKNNMVEARIVKQKRECSKLLEIPEMIFDNRADLGNHVTSINPLKTKSVCFI